MLTNDLQVRIRPARARIDRLTKRDLRFNPIRLLGISPKTSFMAFGVVSSGSRSTPPTSSSSQYSLDRSPRSKPIVTSDFENSSVCRASPTVGFLIYDKNCFPSSLCFDDLRMTRACSKPVGLSPNLSCTGLSPWPGSAPLT